MEGNWLANGIPQQRVHLEGTIESHPSPRGDVFLKLLHLYYQMMTTLLMPPLTRLEFPLCPVSIVGLFFYLIYFYP